MLGHKYQCCIPLLTIGYNVGATNINVVYHYSLLGIMLGHKYQCCIPLLTIGYNVGPQISMLYTIINYWV